MNLPDAISGLLSTHPTERARILDDIEATLTVQELPSLRRALQNESVPSLRRRIASAIARLESAQVSTVEKISNDLNDLHEILEENAVSWIRHELEPAIGWLRLAANNEIQGFPASETNRAIEALRRRLDNAEALLRATAPPKFVEVSLFEAVGVAVAASGLDTSKVSINVERDWPDDFITDVRLLELIIQNAVANALDGILQLPNPGERAVHISGAVTTDRFWLRISNQFAGSEFAMAEVAGVGVTVKLGHQGQGMSLMRHAARRLGYQLRVEGTAGVAEMVLTGPRQP